MVSTARHRSEGDAAHTPSARLWLGNISNQATAASVRAAFESFGPVIDAAAFPARIGPLGYAIVVFERVRCCWLPCIGVQMFPPATQRKPDIGFLRARVFACAASRADHLMASRHSVSWALQVEDAVRAVATKNNRPDPLLTGSRPLKMRYKPDKARRGLHDHSIPCALTVAS